MTSYSAAEIQVVKAFAEFAKTGKPGVDYPTQAKINRVRKTLLAKGLLTAGGAPTRRCYDDVASLVAEMGI